jgi:hypothetical protein
MEKKPQMSKSKTCTPPPGRPYNHCTVSSNKGQDKVVVSRPAYRRHQEIRENRLVEKEKKSPVKK